MSYFGQSQISTYYGMNMGTIYNIVKEHITCSKMVCSEIHDAGIWFDFTTRGKFVISRYEEIYQRSHECHYINCCSAGIISHLQFLQASVYPAG